MHFYAFFNHLYGSLCQGALSLPKWRYAQERFQRAMCPALIFQDRDKLYWHDLPCPYRLDQLTAASAKSSSNILFLFYSVILSELGTSLFEIAQSLFALERTFILGAMVLLETKSEAQWAIWQNQILCGPLMSNIRIKERRTNGWKRHKNARFIHILIKIPARLPPLMYE